jgi:hypothetical protein
LYLGVDLRIVQLPEEGAVGTTWPRMHPRGHFSSTKWLALQLKKVRRISVPISPPCSNPQMISRMGYSVEGPFEPHRTPSWVGG